MKVEHVTTLIAIISIIVLGLALYISVLYPSGISQKNSNAMQSSITVTATGTAEQYPSQGVLYLSINGTGKTQQIATMNLSLGIASVNNSISKYIEGNISNIQTEYYTVSKIRNSTLYQAYEEIKITLPNSNNISAALSQLSNIGNVNVFSASAQLSPSQQNSMEKQALSYALENATQQAEVLANNSTIVIVNITTNQQSRILPFSASAVSNIAGSNTGSIFYYGNQGLTETITVTFEK